MATMVNENIIQIITPVNYQMSNIELLNFYNPTEENLSAKKRVILFKKSNKL